MSTLERQTALLALCRAAMISMPSLPPMERADVYDGICICCESIDSGLQNSARQASDALRDAEMRQLTFAYLLNSAHSNSEQLSPSESAQ
jgi:hypothetical protein